MDVLIQAVAIVAVFSMMHERVLELLRLPMDALRNSGSPRAARAVDSLTVGTFNWVSGVVLALCTHADLLLALRPTADGASSEFFTRYLNGEGGWSPQHILGCVLMGFSTTLGSKFWHDTLNGLMDFRKQLKGVPAKTQDLIGPEVRQSLLAVAQEMKPAPAGDTTSNAAIASVANALKDAASRLRP